MKDGSAVAGIATTKPSKPISIAALTSPSLLLRAESVALTVAALALYADRGGSWWWFLLVLAPDLSAIAYLRGPAAGATVYNLAHTLVWPIALCVVGWDRSEIALSLGLVWAVHITVDRILGYGFKYPDAFKSTHLQRI